MANYQDGNIEVTVEDDYILMYDNLSDSFCTLTYPEAEELLEQWTPHMSSHTHFLCGFRGKNYRSYDVKSIVRILRKIFKTPVKTKKT